MAHGLEVRAPLLDYRILEFAATLSQRLKVSHRQGKLLLRNVASQRLPAEIQNLPKRGFSMPIARWLRHDLKEMASDLIFSNHGLVDEMLDINSVRKMWDEHQNGSRDHNVFLWALIMLGLWDRNHR